MKISDEQIIEKYQKLVYFLAKKLYNRKVEFEDLIQSGYLGLLKAIRNNNDDRTFLSYASKYIIYEMKNELRKTSLVKLSDYLYRLSIKVNNIKDKEIKEIANICNTNIENVMLIKSLDYRNVELINDIDCIEAKEMHIPIDLTTIEEKVYKMRVLYQYSQKEIAKVLNVSQSKVHRIIRKIVEKL